MNEKINQSIFLTNQEKSIQINEESPFSIFSLDLRDRQQLPISFLNFEPMNQLYERNIDIGQFLNVNHKFCSNINEIQALDKSFAENSDTDKRQTLPKQEIKKRNRESAKNCRKKKKQYVENLQEECVLNRKKIKSLTTKVKELQDQLNQMKYSSSIEKQTFTEINRVCLKKLEQLLKEDEKGQIQKYIMEMKARFGPAGTDRVNLLNFYMSQFMENMLADFQKYFINSALKGRGLWGKQQNKFDREVRQILCLSEEQKKLLIKKSYSKVYKEAVLYHEISQKIYQNYSALAIQAKNLQETMVKIKQDLQIKNMGKVVVFFQQNKHRFQIQRLKQQWIQSFRIGDRGSQVSSKLRKKCKIQPDQDSDHDDQIF